jgi:hypothetical protein
MGTQRMSKKRAQQRHARQRALARTGLNIGPCQQDEIVTMIRNGEAEFVRKESNRVTVFDVNYENTTLRVVYDKQRKSLATIMTPDFQ